MATTTTNFGWDIPQSTDLVKDGATAIAALGQDIDTALVDLKGGTTGQVLSKNSNTDMDFTWVAQDDSNAIQNAIVDAKGDLISATAADTPARLASSGINGEVLTIDTSTSTGLKWAAVSTGGMTLIASGSLSSGTTNITSIPGTYNMIQLWLENYDVDADGRQMRLQVNNSGSSIYGQDEIYSGSYNRTGGGIWIIANAIEADTHTNFCVVQLYNYASTTNRKMGQSQAWNDDNANAGNYKYLAQNLYFNSTTAITELNITSSGTLGGGTYKLYGVK